MTVANCRKRKASVCCISETTHAYTKKSRPTLTTAFHSFDDICRDRNVPKHSNTASVWPNAGTYSPQQVFERTSLTLPERDVQRSRLAAKELSHIINASAALRDTVERYRTPLGDTIMNTNFHSSSATRFLSIAPNGRSGTLDLGLIAQAGSWRNLSPFRHPAAEVVLKIPGRFTGHPILRAPPGEAGVSLGMIADSFVQYGSEEFWRCRKAEFFALRDMEVPARSVVTQICLDLTQQSPRQCDQDAMELETCRSISDLDASRQHGQHGQHAPEMMCLN